MQRVGSDSYTSGNPFAAHRRNGFGVLRLFFASLVIVTHTSELRYGYHGHEPLVALFGTISFGDLAVDGFFIISGYLIVASFLRKPDARSYLAQRIARIYPAFAVASLVTVLVVGPLAGASWHDVAAEGAKTIKRILFLQPPSVPGIFVGTPFPVLDGAMWTISHEFRCYLVVLLLGVAGAFRKPWLIATLASTLLLAFEIVPHSVWQALDDVPGSNLIIGETISTVRLTGIFLAGSLFYLWRDRIRFGAIETGGALVAMILCLFVPALAEPAVATFGAYVIFSFASNCTDGVLSRINNRDDISYGVYLYAWPIEKLILFSFPGLSLLFVGVLTIAAACLFGALSWHCVERPVMEYLKRRRAFLRSPRRAVAFGPAGIPAMADRLKGVRQRSLVS